MATIDLKRIIKLKMTVDLDELKEAVKDAVGSMSSEELAELIEEAGEVETE